jgi:hypothetical protein
LKQRRKRNGVVICRSIFAGAWAAMARLLYCFNWPARAHPRGDMWYEGKESTPNGGRRGGAGDVQAMGKLRE